MYFFKLHHGLIQKDCLGLAENFKLILLVATMILFILNLGKKKGNQNGLNGLPNSMPSTNCGIQQLPRG